MEEWLRAQMLATAGISDIAGNRVDWELRPQGDDAPAIVLHLISAVPELKMTGNPTWSDARVQVDCWAKTPGAAVRLRRAVVALSQGLRDVAAGKKYRVFVIDADSKVEAQKGEASIGAIDHRASVDLRVIHQL